MKFVISLTTIPSKIDYLHLMLNSLFNQTVSCEKVIINIPDQYSFRMEGKTIDQKKIDHLIDSYKDFSLELNRCKEDYGPGTKLLGLLEKYNITDFDQDTMIVLADDDVIYKPDVLENFQAFFNKNLQLEVGSYDVYSKESVLIGQGVNLFFIKPYLLKYYQEYVNSFKIHTTIMYHDDIYLSYFMHLKKKFIYKIPYEGANYDRHKWSGIDALQTINGKFERERLNDVLIPMLIRVKDMGKFKHFTENLE